jgi:hypothetical protein
MKELYTALSKAQAEFPTVSQSGFNPFHKSKYSTLKDCWDAARPVLARHGLSVIQMPDKQDGVFCLVTILAHESGDQLASSQPVMATKQDAQSFGSALSYARRYGLTAVLGLVSGDEDDDGNAATFTKNTPAVAPPPVATAQVSAPQAIPPVGAGTLESGIEQRLASVAQLGGLNALYTEYKAEIEAMSTERKKAVLDLFSKRKAELKG